MSFLRGFQDLIDRDILDRVLFYINNEISKNVSILLKRKLSNEIRDNHPPSLDRPNDANSYREFETS